MSKPVLILDQHFRKVEELFRPEAYQALGELCEIVGGQNAAMDRSRLVEALPEASFYVAAEPKLSKAEIELAPNLKATIEVAGAFHEGLDYETCFARGIEVLSCAPGFRQSVSEMTLAMILAGGRGLVEEHERFREGNERWMDDCDETDFTLYGQSVGFIGYGQIARETHRLMKPFRPRVFAHDPYLHDAQDVCLCSMEELVNASRVLVVAAVPSEENREILSTELIERLRPGTLIVVISRAWCVDFDALVAAADQGRIRVATDVFPNEPTSKADPIRKMRNIIFSPHRAAAVPGGRHLIGDMILHDVRAILEGRPERMLKPADPNQVASLVSAQKGMAAQ